MLFRSLFVFLQTLVLCMSFAASAHGESEEREARARFFMPALEVGPVWSSDPRLDVGVLFRTSLDYRLRRVRAPFLRASYDVTTAGFHSTAGEGKFLDANATFHDVLLGGGVRFGPDALQVVCSLQGGLQIGEIPELRVSPSRVAVKTRTRFSPIATAAIGTEWYLFPGVAATGELSARVPFSTQSSFGGALTVGVTTSL